MGVSGGFDLESIFLYTHSDLKQTIINQEGRDRSVYKLLWKIREIYELMITEGELDKIRLMPDVLASLSEQVVECTKFVEKHSYLARLCRATILRLWCMFEPVS